MQAPDYPVRVVAAPEVQASRGMWLIKWLLALPHVVLLFFLWVGVVVVSVIAFFAILVTGRYPRALFDYTVGVLRWSWRVQYYAYTVLGTDRYPPFTLADDPEYPARLDVDYPEQLSRGLVLVKWWLLAVPHYVVVAILSGWTTTTTVQGQEYSIRNPGLIGVLVLIGAVILLFTATFPTPLYRLVVGLNRWVLRVSGYALLLTDEYPPFRLDLDQAPSVEDAGAPPPPAP
jgi:Domain of unknown function (DUF4389)